MKLKQASPSEHVVGWHSRRDRAGWPGFQVIPPKGNSCEAGAMGALPGAEPDSSSARKLTRGFSGRGCLGLLQMGRPPRGSLELGLGRGPSGALSLQRKEDPLLQASAPGSEGSKAPMGQGHELSHVSLSCWRPAAC